MIWKGSSAIGERGPSQMCSWVEDLRFLVKCQSQYHLMPVRVAKMNKSGDYRCWRGCGETGTLLHCWWECKLVQPLWKAVWRFLEKVKIDLPYDPAITLLGIYPRDTGVLMHRDTCTPMFIAAPSTVASLTLNLQLSYSLILWLISTIIKAVGMHSRIRFFHYTILFPIR